MPTRLCLEPRCPYVATYRGRCEQHASERNAATRSDNKAIYNTARWANTRNAVLHDQPLCPGINGQPCGEIATDVHHVIDIANGGPVWARSNLLGLCHACHSRLTRRSQGIPTGRVGKGGSRA